MNMANYINGLVAIIENPEDKKTLQEYYDKLKNNPSEKLLQEAELGCSHILDRKSTEIFQNAAKDLLAQNNLGQYNLFLPIISRNFFLWLGQKFDIKDYIYYARVIFSQILISFNQMLQINNEDEHEQLYDSLVLHFSTLGSNEMTAW